MRWQDPKFSNKTYICNVIPKDVVTQNYLKSTEGTEVIYSPLFCENLIKSVK